MTEVCPICTDKYTKVLRNPISCHKCKYTACKVCYREYILTSSATFCMNPDCGEILHESVIYNNFNKTWLTGNYKKLLVDRMFDAEKGLIPATIEIMEHNKRYNNLKKQVDNLLVKKYVIRNRIKSEVEKEYKTKIGKINKVTLLRLNYNEEYNKISTDLNEVRSKFDAMKRNPSEGKTRQAFMNKCPSNECRGYLNLAYVCGVCEKKFCSSCLEEKLENHECDPNTVETVKLMKKDSKPCPKCSILIFKIEGCNQMYCTQCHTSFDWNSRKIITRGIHNPHYYEYQRARNNQQRVVGDIPCGGLPLRYDILQYINCGLIHSYVDKFIQFINELRGVSINAYQPSEAFRKNINSRKKYINSEISEKMFKSSLSRTITKDMKNNRIYEILVTLATLLEDQMRNATTIPEDMLDPVAHYFKILDECYRIIKYANNCFIEDSKKYFFDTIPQIILRRGRFYLTRPIKQENHIFYKKIKQDYGKVVYLTREAKLQKYACLRYTDEKHSDNDLLLEVNSPITIMDDALLVHAADDITLLQVLVQDPITTKIGWTYLFMYDNKAEEKKYYYGTEKN